MIVVVNDFKSLYSLFINSLNSLSLISYLLRNACTVKRLRMAVPFLPQLSTRLLIA